LRGRQHDGEDRTGNSARALIDVSRILHAKGDELLREWNTRAPEQNIRAFSAVILGT